METSTVVPGGDLAGRSAEYRRGFWRGMDAAGPTVVVALSLSCAAWFFGAWCAHRTDRAEAQLAEMRAMATEAERDAEMEAVYQRNVAGAWHAIATRCLERAREVR